VIDILYGLAVYLLAVVGMVGVLALMVIVWVCYRYDVKIHIGKQVQESKDKS